MLRRLLMFLITALVLTTAVAVVFFGMRVHLKELPAYFHPAQPPAMVDLKLKNGKQIITALAEETPAQVFVMIGGVKVPFGREEIASMEVLSQEALASGAYGQAAKPFTGKKPLVTFKEENRMIDLEKIWKNQKREEKMYLQIGKQRQQQKITESILDKYEQHDAEVKRRIKMAEAKARAAAETQNQ